MDADQPTTVPVAVLHLGFTRARDRYMSEGRNATVSHDALIPMFEALNWATTLDERLASESSDGWDWRRELPHGATMVGLRFARNRVQHQWADALRFDPSGAALPVQLPAGFFEWRWRPNLPLGPEGMNQGLSEYEDLLVGQTARHTLGHVAELFEAAIP